MTVYRPSTKHLYSEINSEAVLLDTESGTYFGLNDVSNQIWQWLQTPSNEQRLLELLLEEYDVAESEARADLQSLLEDLAHNGLIEAVEEQAVQVS
ncbi:MAG: PqqD family protein [Cyanobacteria bacterium P01_G01_bin.67]